MAAGDDTHAAIFFIAVVQSEPGGHAGARLRFEVEVILMQSLTARPAGLK